MLARLAAPAGGGLDLFPLDQHAFVGTVVARAHLLAAAGRPAEGLELLAAATGYAPGGRLGRRALGDRARAWPARLDPDRLARILMQICAAMPDPVPRAGQRAAAPVPAAGRATRSPRTRDHGLLLGAASALARRLGEVALAVDWASRGVRRTPAPSWPRSGSGYAYRSAGRTDEALAALHRAVAHDPDDLSVYADIAGTLADNGRLDEALGWIDRALARDPTFDCAVHTAHRLRYRATATLAHLVALADFDRDHPDDSHEHTDLAECCQGEPWLGQVPAAGDAVANALRQLLAAQSGRPAADPGPGHGWTRWSRRAPCCALAAAGSRAGRHGRRGAGARHPASRGGPPTRQLWRYDGMHRRAGRCRHRRPRRSERIRQLAHPAWPHPPAAYDAAVGLATLDLDDLLGLLVHPPRRAAHRARPGAGRARPALWVRCVQVWACLGLLHHRTDEPWATPPGGGCCSTWSGAWRTGSPRRPCSPWSRRLGGSGGPVRRGPGGGRAARRRAGRGPGATGADRWSLAQLALATPGDGPPALVAATRSCWPTGRPAARLGRLRPVRRRLPDLALAGPLAAVTGRSPRRRRLASG